jgi:GNAT superfamily N-acetyltransferase
VSYQYSVERYAETLPEMLPIYRAHYGELMERMGADAASMSPFNPRFDAYIDANERGDLLHFIVRKDGAAVGYANVYVTLDMHNRDLIATEDAIFVLPDHRKGIGRKLTIGIVQALKAAGVKRAHMTAAIDPRAAMLWGRLGFQHTGVRMTKYL